MHKLADMHTYKASLNKGVACWCCIQYLNIELLPCKKSLSVLLIIINRQEAKARGLEEERGVMVLHVRVSHVALNAKCST